MSGRRDATDARWVAIGYGRHDLFCPGCHRALISHYEAAADRYVMHRTVYRQVRDTGSWQCSYPTPQTVKRWIAHLDRLTALKGSLPESFVPGASWIPTPYGGYLRFDQPEKTTVLQVLMARDLLRLKCPDCGTICRLAPRGTKTPAQRANEAHEARMAAVVQSYIDWEKSPWTEADLREAVGPNLRDDDPRLIRVRDQAGRHEHTDVPDHHLPDRQLADRG